jgi:hypothetical protein
MSDATPSAVVQVAERLLPFHDTNERLGELLAMCVGRLMLKAARKDSNWPELFRTEDIRHIADWLKGSIINDAEWLRKVDEQGRPLKLLKFSSMEGITKEADKTMRIEAQKLRNVILSEGDEEFHSSLSNGMYLVRLLTSTALDRESVEMQHCIGQGAYDELLDDEAFEFLSLRDRFGKAHATLEITDGVITQLQGKQNEPPIKEYIEALLPFLMKHRLDIYIPARLCGFVVDVNGRWHQLDNLPRNLKVADLDLTGVDITSLPDGLKVNGNLFVAKTPLTELPRGLIVGRNLYMYRTGIKRLEAATIGGSLFASNSALEYIAEDVKIGSSIYIKGSSVRHIPDSIDGRTAVFTSDGMMKASAFNALTAESAPVEVRPR